VKGQEVRELPLDEIGLDPRPERQIRPLHQEWVERLMETDPQTWDAIQVRAWPKSDPYPPGQAGRPWQVVSGYHRTSAAHAMRLATIRAVVVEAESDTEFWFLALAGNMRHGLQMGKDQQIAVFRRLQDAGLSYQQIADRVQMPKATIYNWLTTRDTNAGRDGVTRP
jgi:hypothetical protein